MGNDCAMAVYSIVGELWRCGFAIVGTKEGGNVVGIERLIVRNIDDEKEMSEMVERMLNKEDESNE